MNKEAIKAAIISEVSDRRDELAELSRKIHNNPELKFQEVKAAGWLVQYLEENGFSVDRGICKLDTAFKGGFGEGGPVIGLLAEYDALPEVGHACGHNLIATAAVGAATVSRAAIKQFGGSVVVIGTPGEEIGGGKIIMAREGAFDGLDAAMLVHPGTHDVTTIQALAAQSLTVEFFGKPAHAAAHPEWGINALEAMISSFNAINSLRQHINDKARIHGIITDGGQAANIVPAHSAARFLVRAEDDTYLGELKHRVLDCFIGAATSTGARLKYKWGNLKYGAMRNNITIARLFRDNMRSLGRQTRLAGHHDAFGSTDMGNVSQLVPSIHPFVSIVQEGISLHTDEFASAATSEDGIRGMIDATKALALTVVDLLADPQIMVKIKQEFKRKG